MNDKKDLESLDALPMGFRKNGDKSGMAIAQAHYNQCEVEPIEVMQMYFTSEMMHGFCLGNVIKYALRARFKGTEMTDIEKMAQYADWDVQVMRAEKIDPRKVHP